MRIGCIVFSILFMAWGCSLYSGTAKDWYKKNKELSSLQISDNDFAEHLESMAENFISTNEKDIISLNYRSRKYLEAIYSKVVENNRSLLGQTKKAKFIILKNKIPFIFSLPGCNFFMSTGLMANYMGHEGLLVAALSHEIIRSQLNVYQKKRIVPTGYVEIERLMSLTRIDLQLKMKVNMWTYYVMNRIGFDGYRYLSWVQIQNKNALDFLLQLGDLQAISKEEHLFKNFVARRDNEAIDVEGHSSKDFYRFIAYLKKKNVWKNDRG